MEQESKKQFVKTCAICGAILFLNGEVSPYIMLDQHLDHLDKHVHQERVEGFVFPPEIMEASSSATESGDQAHRF